MHTITMSLRLEMTVGYSRTPFSGVDPASIVAMLKVPPRPVGRSVVSGWSSALNGQFLPHDGHETPCIGVRPAAWSPRPGVRVTPTSALNSASEPTAGNGDR